MNIGIRSECDSRYIVYPLIRCLYSYGTVAVFTSNPFFARLIEGEYEGGFKNVRVIVVADGDLQGAQELDGCYDGKYNFVIYDNVGFIGADITFAVVTNRITEGYISELLYIVTEGETHILKYGSPAPQPKKDKAEKKVTASSKKSASKVAKGKKGAEASAPQEQAQAPTKEPEVDMSFNKWVVEKTEEDLLQEILTSKDNKWIKFPTIESIEAMESRHIMVQLDDGTAKEFYKYLGSFLAVDWRNFSKAMKVHDKFSGNINGMDIR